MLEEMLCAHTHLSFSILSNKFVGINERRLPALLFCASSASRVGFGFARGSCRDCLRTLYAVDMLATALARKAEQGRAHVIRDFHTSAKLRVKRNNAEHKVLRLRSGDCQIARASCAKPQPIAKSEPVPPFLPLPALD